MLGEKPSKNKLLLYRNCPLMGNNGMKMLGSRHVHHGKLGRNNIKRQETWMGMDTFSYWETATAFYCARLFFHHWAVLCHFFGCSSLLWAVLCNCYNKLLKFRLTKNWRPLWCRCNAIFMLLQSTVELLLPLLFVVCWKMATIYNSQDNGS